MKKLHHYMMILLAGVLGACSSMSVDDPYEDSFPAGFSNKEYVELHPYLLTLQIKDYVNDYNGRVKKEIGIAAYNAKVSEDSATLFGNVAMVQQIYLDPIYVGGTAAAWDSAFQELTVIEAAKAAVAADSAGVDAETKATAKKSPSLWKAIQGEVTLFNFIGVADDITALKNIPIDSMAFSSQYVMYGRTHGWAYRACRADEVNNTPRSSMQISQTQATAAAKGEFVADNNLYCRDAAGVDRQILQ